MLALLLALICAPGAWAQTAVNIDISGVDAELEKNIRLFLSLEQQKDHPLMSPGRLRRLHAKARGEITAALQPYGYYRPSIKSELERSDSGTWQASYDIDPGPALPIGELNLEVSSPLADDPGFANLLAAPALQPGLTFNHLDYEKFKDDLTNLAAERGYFRARFVDSRVEIDLNAYSARIHLDYEGGPRFRFGEVELRQQMLEVGLLRRYVPFERGDYYLIDKVLELQQALIDSDFFQTVDVTPGQPSAASDEIPILVELTPRKENRYELGLGYGTDTGARTSFGWQKPRINARGHKFDSEVRLAELGYRAQANYRVPVLNPRTDQIVYSIGAINEDFEDSESDLRTVSVSLNHSRGNWRETLSLTYQDEDFSVGELDGSTALWIPGVAWSRTWGRGFINVLDGLRFDISLRGGHTDLASDIDFSQARGGIKFITSLGPRDRIIARGGLGATSTPDFDQLPTSLRFYAGGAQTVRGYAYQSLGPEDDDGDVIGARYMMFGGIEYEHYFNDRWGAALFYDAGNAIDNLDDELESGAGFGLRWKSPIGPVRVDLANAISDDDRPWRLHINIGPDL